MSYTIGTFVKVIESNKIAEVIGFGLPEDATEITYLVRYEKDGKSIENWKKIDELVTISYEFNSKNRNGIEVFKGITATAGVEAVGLGNILVAWRYAAMCQMCLSKLEGMDVLSREIAKHSASVLIGCAEDLEKEIKLSRLAASTKQEQIVK